MLYLVHRVTISIKLRPVKLEQAVSESLSHKELLGVQLTCLDPVPASIRARNAQEINITNCDVTTWSWVNLVHPSIALHNESHTLIIREFAVSDLHFAAVNGLGTDLRGCNFRGKDAPRPPISFCTSRGSSYKHSVPMLCPSNSHFLATPLKSGAKPS